MRLNNAYNAISSVLIKNFSFKMDKYGFKTKFRFVIHKVEKSVTMARCIMATQNCNDIDKQKYA